MKDGIALAKYPSIFQCLTGQLNTVVWRSDQPDVGGLQFSVIALPLTGSNKVCGQLCGCCAGINNLANRDGVGEQPAQGFTQATSTDTGQR